MEGTIDFILVDDDPINNMLSEMTIEEVFPNANVVSYTNPKEALEFFLTSFRPSVTEKPILFLDLNMPLINGWEFVDRIEKAANSFNSILKIYILSSSVDPADIKRAKNNSLISSFIEKPLTEEVLISLTSA